jgi:hypothetical protein
MVGQAACDDIVHLLHVVGKLVRHACASLLGKTSCAEGGWWETAFGSRPPHGVALRFFRHVVAQFQHGASASAAAEAAAGGVGRRGENAAGLLLCEEAERLNRLLSTSGVGESAAENVGFATVDDFVAELNWFEQWYTRCHRRGSPVLQVLLPGTVLAGGPSAAAAAEAAKSSDRGGVCDTNDARRVIKTTSAAHVARGLFTNAALFGSSSGTVS